MTDPRTPEDGEVQIVVLLGADTFIGWAQADAIGGVMDAFEHRAKLTPADRTDQLTQAAIRARIAGDLRGPDSAGSSRRCSRRDASGWRCGTGRGRPRWSKGWNGRWPNAIARC